MEYYLDAWKNYVNFKGRATRKQFWMFFLINCIISIGLQILEALIGFADFELLSGLYSLAVFLPSLAITARRLHDVNKSAWWLLLLLVPIVGALIILIFNAQKGVEGANKYGQASSGTTSRTSPTGEPIREAEVVEEDAKSEDEPASSDSSEEAPKN